MRACLFALAVFVTSGCSVISTTAAVGSAAVSATASVVGMAADATVGTVKMVGREVSPSDAAPAGEAPATAPVPGHP